ncbi:MAG: Phosphoribosyl isomerase A [Candidatus Omnitrophica bacterium ADurb.Bin292]|jgi:phosphoribosylformimino-5-aminoimidazole carboxamide ribotide isomerase|nr:MAG: Phosphoribosyl isomerase A [Candidatus Omnitrophica bacterium ADurb.Bin292]HQB12136.1 1-(5-phosphoribosyl)-5-[(5-phosphoribosylamino)methylideneamino]imidazole-4-carboxamide isomerase [Candidatus Omnitrophota bacterium]
MMNLYPAIDLYQGKVVRLTQGDFNACTIYSNDPSQVAREWESAGAQWIHVVDLEGAKTGVLSNDRWVAMICKSVKAHVQCGGGLRNMDSIRRVLDLGVARVVLGTRALEPVFLEQCVRQFADRLAVGLDVRGGFVKTSGWTRDGNMNLADTLAQCNQLGVQTVICTDIDKDGVLEGPNFKKLEEVLSQTKARVILSGGIATLQDLEKCRTISAPNFDGAIIGKALYEKKFTLTQAFQSIANGNKERIHERT